ncbi:MAG: translation initiation factor IF-3 [Spirosomaceae bacterium]|jgi:translation initiation factor IF-3|nr:translation initiation factor IF-3 [Spirosomataceae bacterium]
MNNKPPFNKNFRNPRQQEDEHRINGRIRVPQVRLVGENVEQGIFETSKALAMAEELGLDLVEIVPTANPPVCRVVDYSKFKYEQKKKKKEMKQNAAKTVVKEIRFGPQTDEHDYNFKLKHAQNFLKDNAKVKAFVQFVGRQIVFKNQGFELLNKFIKDLEEYGKPESELKLEGKRLSVFINPKPKK